jgi:membrane-bound serine protease (ClpP class)
MEDSTNLTLGLALVVGSFVFLIAELFIPSSGVLFVLSIAGLAVGVAFTFFHSATAGVLTLVGVFIALPVLGGLILHYWPKTTLGRRFFLTAQSEDATVATIPLNKELEDLRGQHGKTLSALRPAGVADFCGRRVDVITEGMMVDAGCWVRCIDVQAGRVLVRPVDRPPQLERLESPDFS